MAHDDAQPTTSTATPALVLVATRTWCSPAGKTTAQSRPLRSVGKVAELPSTRISLGCWSNRKTARPADRYWNVRPVASACAAAKSAVVLRMRESKAMIDRTQALWARRYVLKKDAPGGSRHGVLLAVGATRGTLVFVGVRLTAKYFFDAINVSYAGEILVRGADDKGAILEQPKTLEQARDLGRRLARGEILSPIKMAPLAV